ncbi:MAG: pyruvate:ferredoxin (flavodoxin) oxidoreductase, partial [Malacoplasma sp.]|nr:pyruvate:ferredoxin (flavodoxin) oxidoreductase [Malacoplasma sp.]
CTMVCPHAAIRPYLVDSGAKKPSSLKSKEALGIKGKDYIVQVSPLDCTGCNSCVNTCPAKNKALVSRPLPEVKKEQVANYEFCNALPPVANIPFKAETVKGAQFLKPYFEFNGACAGCGETPYVRLVTQLFGKNMMIANATGCSSIYGGSAPSCPYTKDEHGHGPSWANSLFEDNAEFGYGMYLAIKTRREHAFDELKALVELKIDDKLKVAIYKMIENKDTPMSNLAACELAQALQQAKGSDDKSKAAIEAAIKKIDLYAKKSQWIIGGDGWAYDIGYGGLDHVLASGENVNILVLDTEVYSNTGGQSSKSTPTGSIAKFAASGKATRKKDLGMMAMSYKNVYVAQTSMGANPQQLINALVEAESYNGPSIVICYAPCINHGTDLSKSQEEEKKAVLSGYWTLYRFDPRKENPMTVDSIDPTMSYQDFLLGETRYASLNKKNPERAKVLFAEAEAEAAARRATYKEMANSKK